MNFFSKAWAWIKSTVATVFKTAVVKPVEVVVVKPVKAVYKAEKKNKFRVVKFLGAVIAPMVGVRMFNKWNAGRLGIMGAGETLNQAIDRMTMNDIAGIPSTPIEDQFNKQGLWALLAGFVSLVIGVAASTR